MVYRKSHRLRTSPAAAAAAGAAGGPKNRNSASGSTPAEVNCKTVTSFRKNQEPKQMDYDEDTLKEKHSSSQNAVTESSQSVSETENAYEEAHGLLLLAKLSEEERAASSPSRPKRNLKRPAKFSDTFVKDSSPKKLKTADKSTADDGKTKHDLSPVSRKSAKSPAKKVGDISRLDGSPCVEEKEAFCFKLNLQGKTKQKQNRETNLKKDVKQTKKIKQKKGVKSALKSQSKKIKQMTDGKTHSETATKKPKQKKDGESVSFIKATNKREQKCKKQKVYKKSVSKNKEIHINLKEVTKSEKSFKSKNESQVEKHLVHVLVDTEVLKSSKTAVKRQTVVPKSNSFANACVVQFGGKAFILNTPPSVGELTPNKVLHQLLPFVKEKCLGARDMVIKEVHQSPGKDGLTKDGEPQEKQSMSGIEAILKAVEMMSTDEKAASSSQCQTLGECYLTYPIHSANNDISYKTVRMSNLESLEISKTLSKFVEKEHDYTGRKGNDSSPKRSMKAVKIVGSIKNPVGRPRKSLVKENCANVVKGADESASKQYKNMMESSKQSTSVSIQTDTADYPVDACSSDSVQLESDSESSNASADVKHPKKADAKEVKAYPKVNSQALDSNNSDVREVKIYPKVNSKILNSKKIPEVREVKVYPVVNGEILDSKKMPDPIRVEDPENWQQFALFKQVCEKCEKCHKTFSSNRELRQHFTTVHKAKTVKLNKCPDCSQEFELLSCLKHHQLLAHKIGQDLLKPVAANREAAVENGEHSSPAGVKPMSKRILPKCSECRQAFPCAEQLRDHLILCHSNKVVFSDLILCELCDEVFMLVKDFLLHKRDVHNLNPNMSRIGQKKQTFQDKLQTAAEIDEIPSTHTEIEGGPSPGPDVEEVPVVTQKDMPPSEIKGDLLSLMQMTSQHVEEPESKSSTSASGSVRNDHSVVCRSPGHRTNPLEIEDDDTDPNITNNLNSCGKNTHNIVPVSNNHLLDQSFPVPKKQLLNKPLHKHKNKAFLKSFSETETEKYLKSLTEGENDKDVKLFYCDVCNKHVTNLHTHILVHTGEKPFRCTACRLAFSSSAVLKMHLKLHSRGHLPFICSVCGKRFLQESTFMQHASFGCNQPDKHKISSGIYSHSEDQQVDFKEVQQHCSVDGQSLLNGDGKRTSQVQLNTDDHQEGDSLLTSEVQGVSTDHSYGTNTNVGTDSALSGQIQNSSKTICSHDQTVNFDTHIMYSDSQVSNCDPQSLSSGKKADNCDEQPVAESFYRCMICGKVGADLHSHMMTHATEAVNKCNDCGKGFTSKLALKDHMSTHKTWVPRKMPSRSADETLKWHQCRYCEKKFLYMQSLHRHLVSHTGVYPRHCFVCSKGFIYPKDMYFHIRSHGGYEDWSPEKPTTKDQIALSDPNVSMIECGTDSTCTDSPPSEEGGCHVCSKCKSKFRTLSEAANHFLFKCHICGKAYKKSGSIIEHMTVHSEGVYKCDVCESTFQTRSGLRSHKTVHIQGDFQCPHCSRSFIFKSRLNKHLLTHEESKSFECKVCQKRYRYKGDLTKHKVVHEGEKKFRCTLCPRAFHTQTELKSHSERVHPQPGAGRQLYMCNVCGRESQSYAALKTHIKIHSALKPYSCKVCGKSFHSKTNCNQHMRVHSDDKPFRCDLCPKQYKSSNALHLHHQVVHEGIRPYSCKICGKSFSEQNKLYLHMRCHTGETPYECSLCDKRFSHKSLLTNHTAVHTGQKKFVCEFCQRCFTQRTNLVVHRRRHTGERPYGCKFCSNSYRTSNALASHVRTHTGELPFVCDVCPEAFMMKKKLWKHMKVHSSRPPYQCRKCRMLFVVKENFDKHYHQHVRDEENARRVLQAEQEKKKQKRMSFLATGTTFSPASSPEESGGVLIQCYELPFACSSCSSRFRTAGELNNHKTSHLLQPFQCALCKETFCSPDVLSAHLVKHVDSSITPSTTGSCSVNPAVSTSSFTCNICYKLFSHENNLIAHKKTHVYVKPEPVCFDLSSAVSSITSDTCPSAGDVSRSHDGQSSESGPVVVVEYTDSEVHTQQATDGTGYMGSSQESIIIERGVSESEQQPYITIQVPPDYNENINDLISQASDYLDILIKNEITI